MKFCKGQDPDCVEFAKNRGPMALDHRHAAVDMQRLPRDIGRFVAGQIDHTGCDIVDHA